MEMQLREGLQSGFCDWSSLDAVTGTERDRVGAGLGRESGSRASKQVTRECGGLEPQEANPVGAGVRPLMG